MSRCSGCNAEIALMVEPCPVCMKEQAEVGKEIAEVCREIGKPLDMVGYAARVCGLRRREEEVD